MPGKLRLSVYLAAAGISISVAVRGFSADKAEGLFCGGDNDPVCAVYKVCRPLLEEYPESKVTETGKDCTLTVENRQLIIRRKRTGSGTGYFFYYKTLPRRAPGPSDGADHCE